MDESTKLEAAARHCALSMLLLRSSCYCFFVSRSPSTIRYDTIRYDTIRYDTIQYLTCALRCFMLLHAIGQPCQHFPIACIIRWVHPPYPQFVRTLTSALTTAVLLTSVSTSIVHPLIHSPVMSGAFALPSVVLPDGESSMPAGF